MSISLQLMDPNCKPVHACMCIHRSLQQSKEIVRLMDIGVLEEDYSSEWTSPSFAIHKKDGGNTIRVVTDSRKLNVLLKRRMSPISYFPKIGAADMIRSMEGFTFASALDLNMGYHHIKLDDDAQNLHTLTHHGWVSRLSCSLCFSKRHV
jgi:hypothetical protein